MKLGYKVQGRLSTEDTLMDGLESFLCEISISYDVGYVFNHSARGVVRDHRCNKRETRAGCYQVPKID